MPEADANGNTYLAAVPHGGYLWVCGYGSTGNTKLISLDPDNSYSELERDEADGKGTGEADLLIEDSGRKAVCYRDNSGKIQLFGTDGDRPYFMYERNPRGTPPSGEEYPRCCWMDVEGDLWVGYSCLYTEGSHKHIYKITGATYATTSWSKRFSATEIPYTDASDFPATFLGWAGPTAEGNMIAFLKDSNDLHTAALLAPDGTVEKIIQAATAGTYGRRAPDGMIWVPGGSWEGASSCEVAILDGKELRELATLEVWGDTMLGVTFAGDFAYIWSHQSGVSYLTRYQLDGTRIEEKYFPGFNKTFIAGDPNGYYAQKLFGRR